MNRSDTLMLVPSPVDQRQQDVAVSPSSRSSNSKTMLGNLNHSNLNCGSTSATKEALLAESKISLNDDSFEEDKRELPESSHTGSHLNSSSNSGSPSSVIEIFQPPPSCEKPVHEDVHVLVGGNKSKSNHLKKQARRSRGVDSPKRAVDTKNVYASHFSATGASAALSKQQQLLQEQQPYIQVPQATANCHPCKASHSRQSSTFSALTNSSTGDSSTSSNTQVPTSLEAFLQTLHPPPLAASTKAKIDALQLAAVSSALPLPSSGAGTGTRTPTNAAPPIHRRQNTSDSTHSKVAAVARGASKAAQEAPDDGPAVVDRPVACPRRQQTLGSDGFPDLLDEIVKRKSPTPTSSGLLLVAPKGRSANVSPARIVRRPKPPRHDNVRVDGRATMQLMKQTVSPTKGNNTKTTTTEATATDSDHGSSSALDRPVPRPERKPTVEKPSPQPHDHHRDISLTPEALLEKFSKHSDDDSNDARDDNDAGSLNLVNGGGGDDDQQEFAECRTPTRPSLSSPSNKPPTTPTPHPTLHTPVIQAWLNMPHEQKKKKDQPSASERWSNSEPTLKVPRNLGQEKQTKKFHQSDNGLMIMNDNSNSSSGRTFCGDDDDFDGDAVGNSSGLKPHPIALARATSLMKEEEEEEDDTTVNDASGDDRMFQAWLKMPPRVCTTHPEQDADADASIPMYYTTKNTPSNDEQWVATATAPPPRPPAQQQQQQLPPEQPTSTSTPTLTPRLSLAQTPSSIHPDICLDISAIEMSMDLSLPSFFSDCRGHMELADQIPVVLPQRQQPQRPMPALANKHGTNKSGKATHEEMQRRMSLPPPMPHRRKPSLHLEDEEGDDAKGEHKPVVHTFWSSMPSLSHAPPPHPGSANSSVAGGRPPLRNQQQSRDLRASWPSNMIGARLHTASSLESSVDDQEGSDTGSGVPTPSRPEKESLLSLSPSMAGTQKHPTIPARESPSRRASMPPLRPHRRKPSLHLEDLNASSSSSEKSNDDYTARNPGTAAMWASLPVLTAKQQEKRSSLILPPAMPHRRKPSLNILEDGQEGMIEMWLSSHQQPQHPQAEGQDPKPQRCKPAIAVDTPPLSPGAAAPESVASTPSLQKKKNETSNHHTRNDSFACESVCSIILKEGEVEI